MQSKQKITFLIIIVVVAGIIGFKLYSARSVKTIDSVSARSKGNVQAKVQVIEFIDFECPACAFGAELLKGYMQKYPNDIRVQMKYFPLIKSHRHAMQSALYSECAGAQGKFWEFHDQLMPAQKQWSQLISAEGMFNNFAKQAGIDIRALKACLSSETALKTINDDRSLGGSLGVQSTPTYFVNNKMVVGGKSLQDELDLYFPPDK